MFLQRARKAFLHRLIPLVLVLLLLLPVVSACGGDSKGDESQDQPSNDQIAAATQTVPPTPISIFVPSPTPTPLPSPTSTPLVQPTPAVVRSEMVSNLDALLDPEPGIYGVVVLDQDGTYLYARNATVPFVAASLFKLVLVADILQKIEAGELDRSQEVQLDPTLFEGAEVTEDSYFEPSDAGGVTTIDDLLYATAAFSSNIAARALLTFTSPDDLRSDAVSLGMQDTYFFVHPADLPDWPERFQDDTNPESLEAIAFVEAQALDEEVNITTANDISHYWYLMLNNELLSPSVSQAMLDLLEQQAITDRIPALLSPDIKTANKTGNLDYVVHDSAALFLPNGDERIVVALTEGTPDYNHATEVIQRIGLIASGETEIPPYTTPEPVSTTEDEDTQNSDQG